MYYYDICLCFDEPYKVFYNWSKDLIERYLKIEIIRVESILPFITNYIEIDLNDGIYLVSDTVNALAIEVSKKCVTFISSLLLSDENEATKLSHKLELSELNMKILNKRRIENNSDNEIIPLKVLSKEIENGSDDFIKYIYFYIFNKKCNNIDKMRKTLLEDINNNLNDNYLKIYKIIYK